MAFDDLALLLPSQRVEDRTQLPTGLAKDRFPPPLRHEYHVVPRGICSPILNGISFDKFQTLHPLLVDFIKPLGEDSTPGTVKPLPVSLVQPVAYPLSYTPVQRVEAQRTVAHSFLRIKRGFGYAQRY